jgi:hypothetical protein
MALFDAFDLLSVLGGSTWRFFLPAAIGIGAGLGVYFISGQNPAGAAVAFVLGLAGVCVGFVWEFSHQRRC